VRTEVWRSASRVVQAVETWPRDGKPHNTVLQDHEVEVPKLNKGETITDAIERYRRRGRELKADLHRIQSALYPSGYISVELRQAAHARADRGTGAAGCASGVQSD
jgi:hypothetical protein